MLSKDVIMHLPERLKPINTSRTKLKKRVELLEQITNEIDHGAKEDDKKLKSMMLEWNAGVVSPCEFSDFHDYSSWTSAKEFMRSALNQVKYLDDLLYEELIQILEFICCAQGSDSEQDYAINLLDVNFDANPSDLIYWPNEWFGIDDEGLDNLTSAEMAGYLMEKANRHLANSPKINLKYAIPKEV